jgi:hypothetical protein
MFALCKKIVLFGALALLACACGKPALDPNTTVGQAAIIDQTNIYLTTGDCTDALITILPLYNSSNTNNEVRMLTASAYACESGVNFFTVLTNMTTDANTLSGTFWGYFAQLFPSTLSDKVVESSGYAMNTLMTVLIPGQVILPSDLLYTTTVNPASLNFNDRTGDSNIYMLMVSMAAVGGTESRYGNPNSTYHPQSNPPLPFNDNVSKMTDEGCIYAAGVLNFLDSIGPASAVLSSDVATILNQISSEVSESTLDAACDYGCRGTTPPLGVYNTGNWVPTGCSIAAGCSKCPTSMRDYTQCHPNVANDPAACAAAGIANFVNASLAAWQ